MEKDGGLRVTSPLWLGFKSHLSCTTIVKTKEGIRRMIYAAKKEEICYRFASRTAQKIFIRETVYAKKKTFEKKIAGH